MHGDDVLAGAHTMPEAIKACDEVKNALSGCSLRKWTSNTKQITSRISTEHVLHSDFLEFEDSSHVKTLGFADSDDPSQQGFQRNLFRDSKEGPVRDYFQRELRSAFGDSNTS